MVVLWSHSRMVARLTVDTLAPERDTRGVLSPGSSRQRLAGILSSAFAEGLLSEQTYSYRIGLLFGPRLVDPQGLVGDLKLRTARWRPFSGFQGGWTALLRSVRGLAGSEAPDSGRLLLALDGSGSDRLLIGRDPRCDIVVQEPSVSRRHAQLTFRDGVWVIQDLASTNGTAVNGARVGRIALHAGDIVTLGGQPIEID